MKQVVKTRAFQDRLKGHKDGVVTLQSPNGPDSGVLYSCSFDGCVRAWDLIQRKITTKLLVSRVPNQTVNDYEHLNEELEGNNDEREEVKGAYIGDIVQQIDGDKSKSDNLTASTFSIHTIYGGFGDGMICGWNLKSGEIVHRLQGHSEKITSLCFLNPRLLISSSFDCTIRSWDVMTGASETIYKMKGQINLMKCLSQFIYCILDKSLLYEINSESFKVTRCVQFSFTQISQFIFHENKLILGTIFNTIQIYNMDTFDQENFQPEKCIQTYSGMILSMNILDTYLFTGGDDKKIRVWDLAKDMTNVEELNGHDDGVISLEFADGMLYSGSFDHMILSWDLQQMYNRIRERNQMFRQDISSRKYQAWYQVMYKKQKKAKKGQKGKQK